MGFYPPHVFTNDAKRHQIDVRRPDINLSDARCSVEPPEPGTQMLDAVRIGAGVCARPGEAGANRIEEERALDGAFQSLFEFVQRTGLGREPIQNLIRIGAFDDFGLNRRELIWQLGLFWGGLQKSLSPRSPSEEARPPAPTLPRHRAGPGHSHRFHRLPADDRRLRAALALPGPAPHAVPPPLRSARVSLPASTCDR